MKHRRLYPLVLALHGGGGTGEGAAKTLGTTLGPAADARGVILVYPDGVDKHWNDGRKIEQRWFSKERHDADDVGFLGKLLETLKRELPVDPDRCYATGISNGGFMSLRLGYEFPDRLAGVAAVAAQLSEFLGKRRLSAPLSALIIAGTEDPIVPYAGGAVRLFKRGRSRGMVLSVPASVARLREQNGCSASPKTIPLPDKDPKDGTTATYQLYEGGRGGTAVGVVEVKGGGHAWPGRGGKTLPRWLVGRLSRDFDASALILDFFLTHPKRVTESGGRSGTKGKPR